MKKLLNWKIILAIIGIVCGLALVYSIVYSLVILPTRREDNRVALERQKQKQDAEQEKRKLDIESQKQSDAEQEKKEEETKKITNQISLDQCLDIASAAYTKTWADSCVSTAKQTLNECFAKASKYTGEWASAGESMRSLCQGLYSVNSKSDCKLPQAMANSIEDGLKSLKDDCYRKYPTN